MTQLAVVLAVALSGTTAVGQSGPPTADRPPRPPHQRIRPGSPVQEAPPASCPRPVPDRRGWPRSRPGPGTGLEPYFFRLSPEDRRPLAPGEEEELLEFARRELPRLYELLEHLRQRDPGRFPQRLAEHAPRLRHFRRLHELSPQLAATVRDHADNVFRLQRVVRSARRTPPGSPEREQLVQSMRSLVRANLELEIRAADLLAELLDQQRERRVAERVAALLAGATPLPDEPEALSGLLDEYGAAGNEADRAVLRIQIEILVAEQAEREVAALRRRAEQMRQTIADECEQRLAHLLERMDRPPGPPGGRFGPPPGEPGSFEP